MSSNHRKKLFRTVCDELARRGRGRHGPAEIGRVVAELEAADRLRNLPFGERVQLIADVWEAHRAGRPSRPVTKAATSPPFWLDWDWPRLYDLDSSGRVLLNVELVGEDAEVEYLSGLVADGLAPGVAALVAASLLQRGGGSVFLEVTDAPVPGTDLGEFDEVIAGLALGLGVTIETSSADTIAMCVLRLLDADPADLADSLAPDGLGQHRWVMDCDGTLQPTWAYATPTDVRHGRASWDLLVVPDQNEPDPFSDIGLAVMDGIASMRLDAHLPGRGSFTVRAKTVVGDDRDGCVEEPW